MTYKYETQPCTRCGGSGHYSYCSAYGTVCFKCSGSGKQLTRAGDKARRKFEEVTRIAWSKPVAEVEVGDRVKSHSNDKGWRTVVEPGVSPDGSYTSNGVVIPSVTVHTTNLMIGMASTSTILSYRPLTEAEQSEIIACKGVTMEESA